MIDHVIDVDLAERPAEQRPVPAELAKARADVHAAVMPGCRDLARATVACVTTAATGDAIAACERR